ncbi:BTAD domain-containing putative transcriptional regulator [Nonomuraea sp. NPDC050556]|uniref:BTAD domain-containing putative transcriptional regulator n=1 Tax=Nonomuraea sp. NPDC050556 TaxID=3364369 RepID=UPI00379D2D1C
MRFGVLGTVEVWRDDDRLEVGTPRNRAVLARLLLSRGKVIPIDRLIDDLWEGEAPPQALSSLRTFVCQLRRVLEPRVEGRAQPSVLVTEPRGYVLRTEEDALDSARFERLVRESGTARDPRQALGLIDQALDLWRGPAYAEFAHTLWAEGEVARLEELRLGATERRLDTLLTLGRQAEAVPELEAHARSHPTREEGWRLLALGLYRSSRQGDALAALRDARSYLAEELGVDPGPGLRQLEADILAQTVSLELPRAHVAPTPIRCLGRDDELAAAGAALASAEAGTGGSLVFDGEPGAGKTQLLRGAEALAGLRGFTVAWAQAHPLERDHPYGVARQVFEPLLCALPAEERAEVLGGIVAPAADVVWHNQPSTGGSAVLHALYWLAVRLAERAPLLIALDDLQWCDPESQRWLAYLARRIGRVPVVVAATRAAGVPAADPALLDELCALLGPVELGGLPEGAATALAVELFGVAPEPAFVTACLRETGGNAFLLAEHMKGLAAGARPASISRWVADRLRHAGPRAAELARTVAVLDGSDLPEDLEGLEVLVEMGLICDDLPLRFAQPVVRQAILDDLPRIKTGQKGGLDFCGALRGAGTGPRLAG